MVEQRARKPKKTLDKGVAPFGDDVEPIEVKREDVEMGNDEDEEPLEAEVPRARMKSKNPKCREKQEQEDSGQAVNRSWSTACVEGCGAGWQHRIEMLKEEMRETVTPIFGPDYGFMTQENANTLPIMICRDSRNGQNGATCCVRKCPTAYSISFLFGVIKDLGLRRITLKM